jgi:phenylpropionate dioxygenase-like ring-hydroxylating dioxygenase large terminal subunit
MTNASINHYEHWFTITQTKYLDPSEINAFTLLDRSVVVWKPSFLTKYSVFFDKCPNCKKPLRTGHIDHQTGNLVCSYSGCQFDVQGACTNNLHAEDSKFITNPYQNYCVTTNSYRGIEVVQTREENGLLMGFSPDGKRITIHIERLD